MPRGDVTASYSSEDDQGSDASKPLGSPGIDAGKSPRRAAGGAGAGAAAADQQSPPTRASVEAQKRRGPNPSTDYKMHFVRQKERYDTASSDHTSRTTELRRASLKQLKLSEEIEFLLDAIAGEMHRRRQIQAGAIDAGSQDVTEKQDDVQTIPSTGDSSKAIGKGQAKGEEQQEEGADANEGTAPDRTADAGIDDDELLALAGGSDDEGDRDELDEVATPASRRRPPPSDAGTTASTKRQRPSSLSDTEDELLEAAGLSSPPPASKRARNA